MNILKRASILFVLFTLTACDLTDPFDTKSGSSDSGSAPSRITGYKMVQTVTKNDGKSSTIRVGGTVTYQFISSSTVLGAGLNTLPTTSWSYSASGSSATVKLYYEPGYSVDKLDFTSETRGTYRSDSTLYTGTTGWTEGTFVITKIDSTSDTTDTTDTTSACQTNGTGQLSVYTSVGDKGNIYVKIDGSSAGTLSYHYTSGSPTCGTSTSSSVITKTLSAGSHAVSATSDGSTYWSTKYQTVTTCGCLNVVLR